MMLRLFFGVGFSMISVKEGDFTLENFFLILMQIIMIKDVYNS